MLGKSKFSAARNGAILGTIVMNTVYCRKNYTWGFTGLHGLCMTIARKINIRYNVCS